MKFGVFFDQLVELFFIIIMDISSDILSTLSLINSNDITENDLLIIFDQCNKIIQNNTDHSTDKIDSIKIKILIFAINSLMLEACKCQINYQTLIRSLQDSGLDCSTQKFELFKNFQQKNSHHSDNDETKPN